MPPVEKGCTAQNRAGFYFGLDAVNYWVYVQLKYLMQRKFGSANDSINKFYVELTYYLS